jgi:hypothetical protein
MKPSIWKAFPDSKSQIDTLLVQPTVLNTQNGTPEEDAKSQLEAEG